MNERWRVALAGIVAALAIPFLAIDTPASVEGIETAAADEVAESADASAVAPGVAPANSSPPSVEVVVVEQAVRPDVTLLSSRAVTWGKARSEAIADGRVEVRPPAPSNTNLSLLPTFDLPAGEPETNATAANGEENDTAPAQDTEVERTNNSADSNGDPGETDVAQDAPAEGDQASPVENVTNGESAESEDSSGDEAQDPADALVDDNDVGTPEVEEDDEAGAAPTAPAQVNGRVPPPPGGPTAEQWDALRFCESTHNYAAINHTGTFRGAYQFSQQTWDWVAGIHQPHLVGVDPAQAEPAWQDIMAYTLFAMRGWDQWPICGRNLL